ncbi:glycosyl transferase [Trinickia symbiotica]|uniref:Glycosyl transferase n=2 Tax=Trinickia symbiotica TaxID=863227 RepID=A0A2N7X608_9BURK|nr:glycosyltransferase family 4 protein [Trinickia symbiotica]PMS37040.1 glycosyl transferase [Trinickia symbiotica]
MRMLHLVLAPRLSGAEVLVKELATLQRRQGYPVWVTSLLPEQDDFVALRTELDRDGVACRFPRRRHRMIGKLWHLFGVVWRFRPDVIFAHATIPAMFARLLPISVPIVYVMHSGGNDFKHWSFRWAERILSRRARALIGVSQASVDTYIATIGTHRFMMVIQNGVDVARFAAAVRSDDSDGAARIVQIGRYLPIKNQLHTVRAFREVLAQMPSARLEFYGIIEDTAYYQSVIDLARSLGIADKVAVNGPRTDVAQALAESDVFVMPSTFEASSIAFAEALASGIPIVANAIPSFAFAERLGNVQLVDTNDPVAYSRALLTAMQQGRTERRLEGMTLDDTANQYLWVARKVLSQAAA